MTANEGLVKMSLMLNLFAVLNIMVHSLPSIKSQTFFSSALGLAVGTLSGWDGLNSAGAEMLGSPRAAQDIKVMCGLA